MKARGAVADDEQLDFEEDVDERKCWCCKRRYQVRRGHKVRHCPWCGAAQTRGCATRSWDDARVAQEL